MILILTNCTLNSEKMNTLSDKYIRKNYHRITQQVRNKYERKYYHFAYPALKPIYKQSHFNTFN